MIYMLKRFTHTSFSMCNKSIRQVLRDLQILFCCSLDLPARNVGSCISSLIIAFLHSGMHPLVLCSQKQQRLCRPYICRSMHISWADFCTRIPRSLFSGPDQARYRSKACRNALFQDERLRRQGRPLPVDQTKKPCHTPQSDFLSFGCNSRL